MDDRMLNVAAGFTHLWNTDPASAQAQAIQILEQFDPETVEQDVPESD